MTANLLSVLFCIALIISGCATNADYTNFRQYPPRSIVVLPPLNETTAVEATYGYLSTVTMPLAEMGYYVFPVALVDQSLKENGMPTSGEMHEVPLDKVAEVFGADAVLFITVEEYGTKYYVIGSTTTVRARASLVDTKTGIKIWEGIGKMATNTGGSGNLVADMIIAAAVQILNKASDAARQVSAAANYDLLAVKDRGLLYGPYHPEYQSTEQ